MQPSPSPFPGISEKLFRRLLRGAAWVTVAGVVLGAGVEWTAILRARDAVDAAQRERLLDGALGVTVFWAMLWISLPIGAIAFWRHIAWVERLLAILLPICVVVGAVVAWTMKSPIH
jgi:uncharacterized Tic20 family protein